MILHPRKKWYAAVAVPADKSILHRALICGALAEGTTEIRRAGLFGDCRSTADCLRALGIGIELKDGGISVMGGRKRFTPPLRPLHAENSGTSMRLLAGILCSLPFDTAITGDASLLRRPMGRVIDPLTRMGASIFSEKGEKAPLRFKGGAKLKAAAYALPIASAQVKSALMLAALAAEGTTEISGRTGSRNHLENLFRLAGASFSAENRRISIEGPSALQPFRLTVPGDFSSAAFFAALAFCLPESAVTVTNMGINESRTAFLEIARRMGAGFQILKSEERYCGEREAAVRFVSSPLKGLRIEPELSQKAIDELPLVAVMATRAQGTTVIAGAGELRVKESDRLAAIRENLFRMGAQTEITEDSLVIKGPVSLKGASIDSFGDHRIAMAMSVAALLASEPSELADPHIADVSFPDFFSILQSGESA